ncbi:MAG: VOC family protein [Chloroflexota bacterium]
MAKRFRTHLMFEGKAEEAMNFYVSLFVSAEIGDVQKYENGTIMQAELNLGSHELIVIDSPINHDFTFTAATSIFVDCESEAELDQLFEALGQDGNVFMPLADYGFSQKFGWVSDRYGVSWQLNLP